MAQGKAKKVVRKTVQTVVASADYTTPEFFGESFGSEVFENSKIKQIAASIDVPNRLSKNPLLNQSKNIAYQQIDKGGTPFNSDTSNGAIDIQDRIELCQKAYYNVSIFRNTIDTMTEFANSEIMFKGGNAKSRKFCENWWERIDGHSLTDKWLREWYRSCNVPVFRFDSKIDLDLLKQFETVYGAVGDKEIRLPIRYVIMNPAWLRTIGNGFSFVDNQFYYVLGGYECARVKNPITDEDKEFVKSLPSEILKQIRNGETEVLIPLDPSKFYIFFCKRQDYEPFASPMFFPVLSDIDLKLTFKGVERILARTVEYVILLIKIGTEENPNPKGAAAMKELMRNETLGRVLVADGTTSMEFIIPDINKVLGPEKYQQVNQDISDGLFEVLSASADGKFSSSSLKVQVFVEKLKEARKSFLNLFLNPEIKRISKELGFKTYPKAHMAEVDLTNEALFQKIIVQLGQIGILTSKEVIEALQTKYLPTPEESEENQKEYKQQRDKGLYAPLIGGKEDKQEEGRPGGSSVPQTTKKISPVGISTGGVLEVYDINLIAENVKLTNQLYTSLEKEIKAKYKIKKLSNKQTEILDSIMNIIVANEKPENWEKVVKSYVENPKPIDQEVGLKLDNIQSKYNVSLFLSAILNHSSCIKEEKNA